MDTEAEYGFIINLDAQGSGLLPDSDKPGMRRRLYDVSGRAFEQAGIRKPRLYQEDRGDGILSILKATVPPRRVVGEWLEYLHQNLRESNRGLSNPLRLRAGLHIGPVASDPHGRSGRAVDLACRLGNCTTAKRVLTASPGSPLVAVVSDALYEDVVRAGGRWVEPDHYRRADVDLQEGRQTAWFLVPGLTQPPMPGPSRPPGPATENAATENAGAEGPGPEESAPAANAPAANAPVPASRSTVNNNHGDGEIINSERIGVINIRKSPFPTAEDGAR
jgi:hypothetical protein